MSSLQPRPGVLLTRPRLEDFRVDEFIQRNAFVDEERYAVAQLKGAAEECVRSTCGREFDGAAFAAGVESTLDAIGIELRFICGRYGVVVRGDLGGEFSADGRDDRFGDIACVLRAYDGGRNN